MKALFFLGHPAHYYLFRDSMRALRERGDAVAVVIKDKDILRDLLLNDGIEFVTIQGDRNRGRRNGRVAILSSAASALLLRDLALFPLARRLRPDVMVGSETSIAHVGSMLRIPSIITTEDDYAIQKEFCIPTFPFATHIVAPHACDLGPWERRKLGYPGYHKLAYLHPARFVPGRDRVIGHHGEGRPFYILRLVRLTAHHDAGVGGLNDDIARRLVQRLSKRGRVYISAERPIHADLEPYRLAIRPNDIHHFLYYADLFIGDSQSMAVEAAVLGTPSIRFSDFAGRIGVLEELEGRYGLTYGIPTSRPEALFAKIDELLARSDLAEEWQRRRAAMLAENIDVTEFLVDVITRAARREPARRTSGLRETRN